jgi:hypothetical protein
MKHATAYGRKLFQVPTSLFAPGRQGIAFDAPEDTRYAHAAGGFDHVLHVFPAPWKGIRAAAGSLPGHKLAIPVKGRLNPADVAQFFTSIDTWRLNRFVFHGMSETAADLIGRMADAGLSDQVYLVYHGNVSQWYHDHERQHAFAAIELAQKGLVRRIHVLKNNHPLVEGRSFLPMLLNLPPALGPMPAEETSDEVSVFIPGTHDWRKNLHCNALGAALSADVSRILHYAREIHLPPPYASKLKHVQFSSRETTFRLMAQSRCTLNVSLAECHPMVGLESEAVGTPCLRGPLRLDALEDHPYVKLVTVEDPTSPFEILNVLQRLLSAARSELAEMMRDYNVAMTGISLRRYLDFIG